MPKPYKLPNCTCACCIEKRKRIVQELGTEGTACTCATPAEGEQACDCPGCVADQTPPP